MRKPPLALVQPKDKPTHDRAVCPECNIPTRGIEMLACPEINIKTGKLKRQGAMKIVYCAACYRLGVYNEIGR